MSVSTPLRGTSLPTKVRIGPSSGSPRCARASAAGRSTKTRVSAPLGTIRIGRRGVASASAASAIARLTEQIQPMSSIASTTRSRLRGPWAGTSSTSARWAVATTGTPSSAPIRVAAQPSGTTIWAWMTSNGQRAWIRRRGPEIEKSIASELRWPRRAPGSVSLRG